MAIKTFNLDTQTYGAFRAFCKARGMSMSAQVQGFMRAVLSEDVRVSEEYLQKLHRIRVDAFVPVTMSRGGRLTWRDSSSPSMQARSSGNSSERSRNGGGRSNA